MRADAGVSISATTLMCIDERHRRDQSSRIIGRAWMATYPCLENRPSLGHADRPISGQASSYTLVEQGLHDEQRSPRRYARQDCSTNSLSCWLPFTAWVQAAYSVEARNLSAVGWPGVSAKVNFGMAT